jgi:hypothetical protein
LNRSLRLAAPATALAMLAAPAASNAQVPAGIAVPGSQCIRYVDVGVQSFPLTGSGFAPNATVSILSNGAAFATVTTDANGQFGQAIPAPSIAGNRGTVSITADDGQGHAAGPLALPEVKLGVIWPRRGKPKQRVLFRAYGFTPGQNVYLHIRRGGKTRGTFKIGKGDAPCGVTKRRLAVMPLHHYSPGTYEYWFGNTKHYDRSKEIGYTLTITRTFRSLDARATQNHWATLSALSF